MVNIQEYNRLIDKGEKILVNTDIIIRLNIISKDFIYLKSEKIYRTEKGWKELCVVLALLDEYKGKI